MGAALSVNASETLNSAITSVLVANTQTCAAGTTQEINATFHFGKNSKIDDVDFTQMSDVQLTCMMELKNDLDVQAKMRTAVEQEAKTKMDGLNLFQAGAAINAARISNEITTNLKLENIITQLTSVNQKANLDFIMAENSTAKNIKYNQQAKIVHDSVAKVLNKISAVADMETVLKQKATTTLIGIITASGLVIIAIVAIALYFYMNRKKSDPAGGEGEEYGSEEGSREESTRESSIKKPSIKASEKDSTSSSGEDGAAGKSSRSSLGGGSSMSTSKGGAEGFIPSRRSARLYLSREFIFPRY